MIFQQFNLAGRLDVLTNVMMGRAFHTPPSRALLKLWNDDEKAQALSALESFDMARLAGQRADTLSGGQQQRSPSPARWSRSPRSSWPTSRSPRSIRATPRW